MLTFWIIAIGLILVALAFVMPPFFKKPVWDEVERRQMNRAIYEEKIAELEQQNLSPEEKKIAQQELDRTLWRELQESSPPQENRPRARWASLLVAICLPLFAIGGYFKVGSPQLIAAQEETSGKKLPTDFDKMVSKLAARLEKNPNDEEGWQMLARSYAVLGDYAQTVKTYNKILVKFGPKAETLTDFAEFLAKSEGNELAGLPSLLLKKALELNPNYQGALWLAGFSSAQSGDFKLAIEYWERFLAQLPKEETEARKLVEQHIADARQHENEPQSPSTDTTTSQQNSQETPSVQDSQSVSSSTEQNKEVSEAKIEVRVSLEAHLQNKVNPEDTLFIYARATEGPPMPLAIVKKKVSDLPLTVTLADNMAMVPSMKLSNYQKVTILARISSSGSANLQSGDLQGEINPVLVGKQEKVEVTINQVIP